MYDRLVARPGWVCHLALVLSLLPAALLSAQTAPTLRPPDFAAACRLQGVVHDHPSFVPPRLAPSKYAGAPLRFEVTYENQNNNEPWPEEARTAFEYALTIWSAYLDTPVPIRVEATWHALSGCSGGSFTLGSAGPSLVYGTYPGLPIDATWYPVALVEALAGEGVNDAGPDIRARFNRACDDPGTDRWYFGTDGNVPSGQIDFVSVALHEIGHGLLFSGSASVDDGVNNLDDGGSNGDECDGTEGAGCIGLYNGAPTIYDHFTVDAPTDGVRLLDDGVFPRHSTELGAVLSGRNGARVYFDGSGARSGNEDEPARLYIPDDWSRGSSYAHLDESTFNDTPHALMTPTLFSREAAHDPGRVVCGMLEDTGWPTAEACEAPLPVTLAAFEAMADGDGALLTWRTASETNNAAFVIEQRGDGASFVEIDRVAGAGTTDEARSYSYRVAPLQPGAYMFRLRQIDFDGTFAFSPEVAVTIPVQGRYAVTPPYPNPFNPSTQFALTLAGDQNVTIRVHDVLGRPVALLHEGPLRGGVPHRFTFDAASLPSGLYLIRIDGPTFSETRRAMLLK